MSTNVFCTHMTQGENAWVFVPEDAMQDTVKAYFKFEDELFAEAKKVRDGEGHADESPPCMCQGTGWQLGTQPDRRDGMGCSVTPHGWCTKWQGDSGVQLLDT